MMKSVCSENGLVLSCPADLYQLQTFLDMIEDQFFYDESVLRNDKSVLRSFLDFKNSVDGSVSAYSSEGAFSSRDAVVVAFAD